MDQEKTCLAPVLSMMRQLHLPHMAHTLEAQFSRDGSVPDGALRLLETLLISESEGRRTRVRHALRKKARLRYPDAQIEDCFHRAPGTGADWNLLHALAGTDWIAERRSIIITGPTGAGKTFLACAIANQAIASGMHVRFFTAHRLLALLAEQSAHETPGSGAPLLSGCDLIIADDLGLTSLDECDSLLIHDFADRCHGSLSLILVSPVPAQRWSDFMAAACADAITDRILQGGFLAELNGPSFRSRFTPEWGTLSMPVPPP